MIVFECYAPAWPPTPKKAEPELQREMSLEDALTEAHPFDAHTVQYGRVRVGEETAPVRLKYNALDRGGSVNLSALIFDVDDPPMHKLGLPSRPEWREDFRRRVESLFESVRGAGVAYYTRSGGRIVYKLEPFAVASREDAQDWTDHYLGHGEYLRQKFGIEIDRAPKAWNSIFRLPRVVRDGEKTEPDFIGDPRSIATWTYDPPAPCERAPLLGGERVLDEVPLEGATGERRLRKAVAYLAFRAPLSIRGAGGRTTMFRVCTVLVRRMRLPLEVAGDLIERFYNPRLIAAGTTPWNRSEPGPHGMCIDERLRSARETALVPFGIVATDRDAKVIEVFRRRVRSAS